MASDEISPHGRWHGKLTSRPLPDVDATIAALEPAARACVSDVWLARAASERRVADSFTVIRDALAASNADAAIVDLAARAVDDEMRHTEICRTVASRYAGRELAPPPLLTLTLPRHAGVSDALRRTLYVVGQCCINETIASAFLEATLAKTSAPLAKVALRELLTDEIDHARIGWARVSSMDGTARRRLEPWLAPMAVANLRMWRDAARIYPDDLAAHGAPPAEVVEDALLIAFRDLVIPGFATVGLDVTALTSWLVAGAPTA